MSINLIIDGVYGAILGLDLITAIPAFPVTSGILLGTVIGVSAGKITGLLHQKPGLAKSPPESLRRNKTKV